MNEHEGARCTANTKSPIQNPSARDITKVRCVRELGHAGLHRYYYGGYVIEFPNSEAWFPHYSEPELRDPSADREWLRG